MQIEESAIEQLLAHPWPGNVRELDNVICRAKVLAVHNVIQPDHIYFDALEFFSIRSASPLPADLSPMRVSPPADTQ